ncbi:NAD(P)-binding protein [Jaminaea rosea]|uniref:NAD(P)-binding protein n=1 Tax=Jaminaea rosea TaxID=1569628 RepID=A0A316UUK5_9BASI|nr:NAD(P)-binding protein [Jaminaea rosea]PWN28987.1 NAD(P)-binding protein [Jaminaea rosea]
MASKGALKTAADGARLFKTSYARTIGNLKVDASTPCIVQGFTGKSSTFHSKLSLDMGTNIVGGVSPGKGGRTHLERPVFDSVKEAVKHVKPHATAVFVPPLLAADAIIDAIENEVPLIVSVAEGIPVHDQIKVMSALHSQDKSRLVGANSPGLVNPAGCRLGISPSIVAAPGPIGERSNHLSMSSLLLPSMINSIPAILCPGIAARSGTLSYEAAASCKSTGQSYIFGLGGDFYPGTRTAEALEFFMNDESTKGIILVGEVGGVMEEEAIDLLHSNGYLNAETGEPIKPIVGFISGRNVPPGQTFGHSGAVWRDGINSAEQKREAWKEVGIKVVDTIADTGPAIVGEMKRRGLIEGDNGDKGGSGFGLADVLTLGLAESLMSS